MQGHLADECSFSGRIRIFVVTGFGLVLLPVERRWFIDKRGDALEASSTVGCKLTRLIKLKSKPSSALSISL
jgi:hypothetical protein